MRSGFLIRKKSGVFILLMICLTALFGGNYYLSSLYTPDFVVVSSMLVSVLVLLICKFKLKRTNFRMTIVLAIIMWISGIAVAAGYDLPMLEILKGSCYTVAPILIYIAFHSYINSKNDVVSLLGCILVSAVMCNIVSIIEMVFALQGIDLLKMNVFEKMRYGSPRFLIGETVVSMGFFLSFGYVIDKKTSKNTKIIARINIVLTAINILWIAKTRSMVFYMIAAVLTIPVLNKRFSNKVRVLLSLMILSVLAFALMSDLVPSINRLFESDYGIQTRFSTIKYYFDYYTSHPLWGAGYISSNPYYSTSIIVSGPAGRFYTSDVGIVGLLFKSGSIGLLWLIAWFRQNYVMTKNAKQSVPIYYDVFVKSMLVFLLFSCINLILTDTPRFPYIAMIMIFSESCSYFSDVDQIEI